MTGTKLGQVQSGQVTGVINASVQGTEGILSLLELDPDLRLVDQRWGGRLVFVVSQKINCADRARTAGAIIVFDAKSVGCSF
jgi:hypothetical protein